MHAKASHGSYPNDPSIRRVTSAFSCFLCLRSPDDGLVRRFDGRRILVIGSFRMSLGGDKPSLNLVGLGLYFDETGSGGIPVECVH